MQMNHVQPTFVDNGNRRKNGGRCRWCGRETKGKNKCCSVECRILYHRAETEKNKPPKHTHCLNPACGKVLNHWITTPSRKSYMYVQNRECCDMACQGAYKSIKMKGHQGNLKGHNTSKRKYVPMDFTRKTVVTDPLAMCECSYE